MADNFTTTSGAAPDGTIVATKQLADLSQAGKSIAVSPTTGALQEVKTASTAAAQTDPAAVVRNADLGTVSDAAWDGAAASATGVSIFKYLGAKIEAVRALLAGTVAVSGPATDAQLRATPILVSGPMTAAQFAALEPLGVVGTVAISGSVAVTGPATDAQMRASAILVSNATGATAAKQPALGTAGTASADVLSVQGIASGTPFVTVGKLAAVSQTFTRPANATAYAINQAVNTNVTTGTVITFANMSRLASSFSYIVAAKLATDLSTCTGQFRLHLYSANTMTIPVDGAAFQFKYADIGIYLGYIDFNQFQTEGAGTNLAAYAVDDAIRKAVLTDASSQVYGLLEAKGAIPTASGQNFAVSFLVEYAS
jgi:hypothetical protein